MRRSVVGVIEGYRRKRVLDESNTVYSKLLANRAEWRVVQKERQEWEVTLGDGVDDD
jgi:hypothetical protein